jgi:small multidrug resistance pump
VSTYYLVLGGSILIGVGAQVALKVGTAGSDSIATQFTRPAVLVGLALYLASAILYVVALRKMTISLAFPTVSLAYILIAAIDHFVFKEPFGLPQLGGTVLIISGVALLHQSS